MNINDFLDHVIDKVNKKQEKFITSSRKFEDFRSVFIILSSSRGGSSLLYKMLSEHPKIVTTCGEHTTDYRVCKLLYPYHKSDRITDWSPSQLSYFEKRIMSDISLPTDTFNLQFFSEHFRKHLYQQYPNIEFDENYITKHINQSTNAEDLKSQLQDIFNWWGIYTSYHDKGSISLPRSREITEPLRSYFIEETPFIFPGFNRMKPEDLSDKILLLKAPLDVYRSELLRALFKNCDLHFIWETRNPASCINGLIDGWKLRRGFYSYHVTPNLSISGYSEDHFMHRHLWNYDLFPNWQQYIQSPLTKITTKQWTLPHTYISKHFNPDTTIKFEDLIMTNKTRNNTLNKIYKLMDITPKYPNDTPVVMASKQPKQYRWHSRRDTINDIITNSETIQHFIRLLDYKNRDDWI